jgi:4-amino-4-deoxy-L-arabinose transferase-like glycosyltransferase
VARVGSEYVARAPQKRRTPVRSLELDTTRRRRVALVAIAAIAGLLYAWGLARDPLEPYYAAAVRSMSMSWHNLIFGAFDPAGTVTLDKLPGAFWVQALAVRVFGFHSWAIVLPQAVEGVLTVLVLYRAVARLAGPTAGLVAALVLAISPATVALNRGNISDSLMILLLVLAADAVSAAIVSGTQRRLILAAVWVGLAFQAKMIEAWMVLPALGLAYLAGGPATARKRARQLVVAGVVAAVVSLSWMTVVSLVPGAQRPYVDGSHNDSLYAQVFVYNGFGRFGDQTPLQLLAGQSLGIGSVLSAPAAAPNRLLHGDLGRDTGWLLPAALAIAVVGLFARRRRPRVDPLRSCLLLWGGWLVTLAAVFSLTTTINAYYTAALSPAVAALLGAGVAGVWSEGRAGTKRRIGVAVIVAASVAYADWLTPGAGTGVPGWLVPATVAAGLVAVAITLWSVTARRDRLLAGALATGLLAVSLAPAVASAELVTHHQGAFDTPFEPAGQRDALAALFVATPKRVALTIPVLQSVQRGAPYLLATQTAALASVFIYDSGLEALPIGGFTGTIPSPTLGQLQADIRAGRFHLVLAGNSQDPRVRWIAAHCLHAPSPTPGLRDYYCTRLSAG